MNPRRADVVLTRVPHAAGGRGKKRPAVVVQADVDNLGRRHAIVAEITTNLSEATDPANLLVDTSMPDGQATGLVQDSVVTCLQLATVSQDRLSRVIGQLSPALLLKLDSCLKAALGLP